MALIVLKIFGTEFITWGIKHSIFLYVMKMSVCHRNLREVFYWNLDCRILSFICLLFVYFVSSVGYNCFDFLKSDNKGILQRGHLYD